MYSINLDTKELNKLTRALQEVHRSAFPVAVRETLNNIAFETKKKEMLTQARETFTLRKPTMISKFSKVDKATGLNAGSLVASVGMLDQGPGQTFDKQEEGGTYEHKYIPNTLARIGATNSKVIASSYRRERAKIVDRSKASRNRPEKSQIVADAAFAKSRDMWLYMHDTLFSVNSFKKDKGKIRMSLRPLYSVKKGRRVKVKGVKFIENSAIRGMSHAEKFYKVAINRQLKKYFK